MVEHADLVAHRHRLDLVVGDEQEGRAEIHLQVLQLGAQRLAQLGVERRQRLVHQEDARLAHDGAADRDALHLAARQPVGLAVEQMLDAQRLGDARDALLDLGVGQPADLRLQREFEVLAHRVARVERILLQHQRHVALGRAPVGDVDAVDEAPGPRSAFPGRRSGAASSSCRRRSRRAARRTRRRRCRGRAPSARCGCRTSWRCS